MSAKLKPKKYISKITLLPQKKVNRIPAGGQSRRRPAPAKTQSPTKPRHDPSRGTCPGQDPGCRPALLVARCVLPLVELAGDRQRWTELEETSSRLGNGEAAAHVV
jgi:hypothetical protein